MKEEDRTKLLELLNGTYPRNIHFWIEDNKIMKGGLETGDSITDHAALLILQERKKELTKQQDDIDRLMCSLLGLPTLWERRKRI